MEGEGGESGISSAQSSQSILLTRTSRSTSARIIIESTGVLPRCEENPSRGLVHYDGG